MKFFPLSINNKIMITYKVNHYSDQQFFLFLLPNLFLSFPFKELIGSQLSPYVLKCLTLILNARQNL